VTAGSIYPQQITISEVKHMFGFTTCNIATALGIVGAAGLALGAGVTCELYEILWNQTAKSRLAPCIAIWLSLSVASFQENFQPNIAKLQRSTWKSWACAPTVQPRLSYSLSRSR
jgi:hypothetical protein